MTDYAGQFFANVAGRNRLGRAGFSKRTLPDEFTVSVVDEGRCWGAWLAIAIKE